MNKKIKNKVYAGGINSNMDSFNRDKQEMLDSLREQLVKNNDKESLKRLDKLEGVLFSKGAYGLKFEDDIEDKNKDFKLTDIRDLELKFIDSKDEPNLLIEGDNLHVMKELLRKGHANSIDFIITDPPYFTTKKFIYKDNFKNKKLKYKYSSWLSMMRERLELSRELLKDDGGIMLCINSVMYEYLKLLCDDIFGIENQVITFIWEHKVNGNTMGNSISMTNEYILFYAKDKTKLKVAKKRIYDKTILKNYTLEDSVGRYRVGEILSNRNLNMSVYTRPNLTYTIYYNPETNDCILKDEKIKTDKDGEIEWGYKGFSDIDKECKDLLNKGYFRITPPISSKYGHQMSWRWSMDKFMREYKDNIEFVYHENLGNYYPYNKARLKKDVNGNYYKEVNYTNSIKGIPTGKGMTELSNMFGKKVFDYPKPTELMMYLLDVCITDNKKDALICDIFSGSGSTLHSVLKFNDRYKTSLKFIGITNNENNICREVTYERLKKVGEGYTYKDKIIEGIPFNLKYYKVNLEVGE